MKKIWFITGSSRGLGRTLTEAILAAGDSVVATARKPEQLADLVEKYGDRIRPTTLDVTSPADAEKAVAFAIEAFGKIDVLVNNAGYGFIGAFEEMTPDEFKNQIDTNFWGVVHVTRAALPFLRQKATATSSRSPPSAAASPIQACPVITPRNSPSKVSAKRSPRKSNRSVCT